MDGFYDSTVNLCYPNATNWTRVYLKAHGKLLCTTTGAQWQPLLAAPLLASQYHSSPYRGKEDWLGLTVNDGFCDQASVFIERDEIHARDVACVMRRLMAMVLSKVGCHTCDDSEARLLRAHNDRGYKEVPRRFNTSPPRTFPEHKETVHVANSDLLDLNVIIWISLSRKFNVVFEPFRSHHQTRSLLQMSYEVRLTDIVEPSLTAHHRKHLPKWDLSARSSPKSACLLPPRSPASPLYTSARQITRQYHRYRACI